MAVSPSQEAAFTGATLGISMNQFQLTVLLILFSGIYLWASWVIVNQWKSWGAGQINFYQFLMRIARSMIVVLYMSFLLI